MLERIGGDKILKTIIELFMSHPSSEKSLSSPEDYAAVGFMKIIGTLLATQSFSHGFVKFLFRECLFPEGNNRSHQLRSSNSRKQAYELIYRMCRLDGRQLDELFDSGFKGVYKAMSNVKVSYYYKEVRSEWGYAGIRNLGCICYMISMLQQFFMTKPFRSMLLMADDGVPESLAKNGGREIDDNLLHQLQHMFANLELTERQ